MKWTKRLLWLLFVVCIVGAVGGLTYWRATEKGITAVSVEEIERDRGMAVAVEQPTRRDFVSYLFCDGEVEGSERYSLRSRVGTMGAIAEEVTVDVGEIVQEGQLLVRFRQEDLEAELEAQKTAFQEAKRNFNRYKNLFEKGVVSADVLDSRRTAQERAASALRRARTQLEYTRVVSPAGGNSSEGGSLYVSKRFVDPGEFKRVGDALLALTDLSKVDVRVQVPESVISELSEGDMLEYRLEKADDWKEGRIDRIQPASDNPNRFFDVYLRVENKRREKGKWRMRPGMYVEARIPDDKVSQALAIKASNVDWEGERQYIYVIQEKEGKAKSGTEAGEGASVGSNGIYVVQRRKVETGIRDRGYVQIVGDVIADDDRIVCNPRVDLKDGDRVWLRGDSCDESPTDGEGAED